MNFFVKLHINVKSKSFNIFIIPIYFILLNSTTKNISNHYSLGIRGEAIAKGYLLSKGYVILETNWRFNKLEVDMIADDGELLVFIEVKTRSSIEYGNPEDAVDFDKKMNLINAAEAYLKILHAEIEVRFDIISIIITEENIEINHIKDAFYPGDELVEDIS